MLIDDQTRSFRDWRAAPAAGNFSLTISLTRTAVVKSGSRSCSFSVAEGSMEGARALHDRAAGHAAHGGMIHGLGVAAASRSEILR